MSTTGRRIWRYGLISAGSLIALVLLLLTVASLAIYTESGSRRVISFVLERVSALDGYNLQSGNINGNLLNGLTLTDLSIEIPAARITAPSVRASWNPYSLLSGSFYLAEFDVPELTVTLLEADRPQAAAVDPISFLRIPPLPVNVAVGALSVANITIVMPARTLNFTNLSLAAVLNGQELGITDLHIEGFDAAVDLNLQAELRDNIPILASVNWEYQGRLFADYELAVGSAAITGDLANLVIQHELLAPEAIHSSGTIAAPLSGGDLQLEFINSTASLRLPFAGISEYLFENVALTTSWSGGDLMLALESGFSGPMLPASRLSAAGALSGASLNLTAASLHTDTGTLSTTAQLDWSGPFQSAFRFSLAEQTPLQYLPTAVPVELTDLAASGEVSFGFIDGERHISVVMDDFRGLTGGYELTGAAAINVIGNAVQIENLRLNTIANEILITGAYEDEIHLNWQLVAPEIGQLLAGINGSVNGSGQIDGTLENPAITAMLQVQGLESAALSAANIAVSLAGTREQLRSSLRVEDIVLTTSSGAQQIALVALDANGNLASHTLNAAVESSYGDATVSIAGGIADPGALLWEGTLNDATLRSDFGDWEKQPGAIPLALSRTSATMAESCWRLAATELCFDVSQPDTEQLQLAASLANFPLAEFNAASDDRLPLIRFAAIPRLPPGIGLAGTVSATLAGVVSRNGAPPQLNFNLTADNAVLGILRTEVIDAAIADELIEVEAQRYRWDTLAINGQLQNNSWNFSGNAALSQQNVVGTNLGLNGVVNSAIAIDADGNLDGVANVSFAELGWIQAFVPELSAVGGSLSAAVEFSGSLAAPLFAGELKLSNGTAAILPLGVTLTDIQGAIAAQSTGDVQFNGALTSATGAISFSGSIADLYTTSRSLQATLNGNNFLLADIEDLKLQVTPELSLVANSELIQINGSLDVPVLNLTLLELPETAVDVSRDEVILNYPADQPELARSVAANQSTLFNIPIAADINLTLGDAVAFTGFGMQATLDGDLSIQQRADGRNLTYGELSIIEGSYSIYGQTLDLRQGKLLFFGAIDNPALDIRAVREAEDVTVGVLMNGTLKNIRSQLFSTPVIPENDIIAVLVTGRPASELGEQDGTAVLGAIASLGLDRGEGLTDQIRNTLGLDTLGVTSGGNINSSALTIGKYLTPDLFIRYGVGLFDRQSKVVIDYSLSERIMLQAESGAGQSVDLTYTVER